MLVLLSDLLFSSLAYEGCLAFRPEASLALSFRFVSFDVTKRR